MFFCNTKIHVNSQKSAFYATLSQASECNENIFMNWLYCVWKTDKLRLVCWIKNIIGIPIRQRVGKKKENAKEKIANPLAKLLLFLIIYGQLRKGVRDGVGGGKLKHQS